MVELKFVLIILLVRSDNAKVLHHNHRQIVTPNNAQQGNLPLLQGNTDEIAMFPPQSSNNLIPETTESPTTCVNRAQTQAPPGIPTSLNDITYPDISIESSTVPAIFETVTADIGTVIRIELPSINIFVNFPNNRQPTVDIPPIVTNVEISTGNGTVDTSIAPSSTVELSTVSSTVEISTTEVNYDLTAVDSTSQMSTTILSTDTIPLTPTVGSTVEITTIQNNVGDSSTAGDNVEYIPEEMVTTSTVDTSMTNTNTLAASTISSTVEISTTEVTYDLTTIDSTSQMSTTLLSTDTIPLTPTVDSTVEITTIQNNIGDSSTAGDNVEYIPEEMVTTSTVDTSMTNANTLAASTISSTVEISITDLTSVDSTSQMPATEASLDTDSTLLMTTGSSTVETPTVEVSSTVGSTVPEEVLTASTVEISTADSTTETSISTINTVSEVLTTEMSTTDSLTVEASPDNESVSIAAPSTINESSTEAMRYIQININLSDNNQNGNFGFTTQPSIDNLGQLQNKMIYKEKCDEYYASSRVGREAKVTVFIIGGTSSMPKEFPHMAALGYGNNLKREWLCGGSLISENYVITAAHCVSSKTYGNVQVVRLGTTRLDTETLNSEDYNVIRRISHPGYSTDEQYNDIALLQLDRPVTFSEYVSPICLYSSNVTVEVLIASGWGKTEATGDVSPELQKVELEYFPNIECQNSYSGVSKDDLPRGILAASQICAGSRTEEKDTCQGDSGGPLQIKDNGRMYLVGITSFGIACGQPGRPGVYTKVSYYIPWIESIVWGSGR